jgi:hypothetical protein
MCNTAFIDHSLSVNADANKTCTLSSSFVSCLTECYRILLATQGNVGLKTLCKSALVYDVVNALSISFELSNSIDMRSARNREF